MLLLFPFLTFTKSIYAWEYFSPNFSFQEWNSRSSREMVAALARATRVVMAIKTFILPIIKMFIYAFLKEKSRLHNSCSVFTHAHMHQLLSIVMKYNCLMSEVTGWLKLKNSRSVGGKKFTKCMWCLPDSVELSMVIEMLLVSSLYMPLCHGSWSGACHTQSTRDTHLVNLIHVYCWHSTI